MQANIPGLANATEGITSNGVPYIAAPPEQPANLRGIILLWHGADPPRSEASLAAALPLRNLDCWRIYLGMPLYGRRAPAGGFDAIMRLAAEDAVRLIFQPSIQGAVDELPSALDDIRIRLGIDAALPLGLFGFSQGGAAALLTLSRGEILFKAAATFGAVVDLHSLVDTLAAMYGTPYEWTPERMAAAESLSSTQRAQALAASRVALLMAIGADDPLPAREPAERLAGEIQAAGGTAQVTIIQHVPHAFVEPPGEAAAPQGPMARSIESVVSDWFERHLF